jgi:hypothetical protein
MNMTDESKHEIDHYGDPRITSGHAKVPFWLKAVYVVMPIWGVIWLAVAWNGASDILEGGYWQQLQRAANTTYPPRNFNDPHRLPKNQKEESQ